MAITMDRILAIIYAAQDYQQAWERATRECEMLALEIAEKHLHPDVAWNLAKNLRRDTQPDVGSAHVIAEELTRYKLNRTKNDWNRDYQRRRRAEAGKPGVVAGTMRAIMEVDRELAEGVRAGISPEQRLAELRAERAGERQQAQAERAGRACNRPAAGPNHMEYMGGDRVVTVTPQPEWHQGDALFQTPEGSQARDTLPVRHPEPDTIPELDTTIPLPGWTPLPPAEAYIPPPQTEWDPAADPGVATADEATILAGLLAGTMTLTGVEAHAYWEPRLAAARAAAAQAQVEAAQAQAMEAERLAKGLPKGAIGGAGGKRGADGIE